MVMYKIDRRGGGGGVQKSFSRKLPDRLGAERCGHMTNNMYVIHYI